LVIICLFFCSMQIFGQYTINQYFLQNTGEIILKEKCFSMKKKRQRKENLATYKYMVSVYL